STVNEPHDLIEGIATVVPMGIRFNSSNPNEPHDLIEGIATVCHRPTLQLLFYNEPHDLIDSGR
ncbi:MAG TPA: hypothetical protein VIS94_07015, partial [Desulfomonilia bacterium]